MCLSTCTCECLFEVRDLLCAFLCTPLCFSKCCTGLSQIFLQSLGPCRPTSSLRKPCSLCRCFRFPPCPANSGTQCGQLLHLPSLCFYQSISLPSNLCNFCAKLHYLRPRSSELAQLGSASSLQPLHSQLLSLYTPLCSLQLLCPCEQLRSCLTSCQCLVLQPLLLCQCRTLLLLRPQQLSLPLALFRKRPTSGVELRLQHRNAHIGLGPARLLQFLSAARGLSQ